MPDPILEVRSLAKSFGAHHVLTDVNIRLAPGEIVGLLGPNGSGKSTVLNMLTGFMSADAGDVILSGKPVGNLTPYQIARRGMVRTFQLPSMPHRMTVRELIAAGSYESASMSSLLRSNVGSGSDVEEILDQFELRQVANLPAGSLSGGQKKLLSIALALQAKPKVLCLDEPTAGVHPALRSRIVRFLKTISESGIAILVIEHDMHFIRELCGRCIVLDRGQMIANCAPCDLAENERVVEAYLGNSVSREKAVA